jgi:hypothetical protein
MRCDWPYIRRVTYRELARHGPCWHSRGVERLGVPSADQSACLLFAGLRGANEGGPAAVRGLPADDGPDAIGRGRVGPLVRHAWRPCIRRRAVTAEEGHAWARPEPGGERLGCRIEPQVDWPLALQVYQQGVICPPTMHGLIVHPQDGRC